MQILQNLVPFSIIFFMIISGCQTIKENLGIEEPVPDSQIVAIWYQKQWYPTFQLAAWQATLTPHQPNTGNKQKSLSTNRQLNQKRQFLIIRKTSNSFAKKLAKLANYSKKRRQTLFLKPGEEEKISHMEVYLPKWPESHWKLIIKPYIELELLAAEQGLLDYIADNFMKNVENIQGKLGVGVDF